MALLATDPTEMLGGVPADNSGPSGVTNPSLPGYTPPASTPPPVALTPQQQQNQNNQQSASQAIAAFLASVPGLSTLDPTGQLASWMNGQVGTLAGQGIDSGTIVSTIESTVNNPSGDPAAQQVFDQIFPGYNAKIQAGTSDTNGQYTGIAGYIQYANQIQAYAQTLAPGTVTAADIGNMWARDISAGEVSDRITSAHTAALNTPQPVQDYLQNTYGIGPGGIASYFLNPTNSITNLSSVNTGIAGVESGFGSMSKAQADSLSAFLSPPSSNGANLVSSQQATQALTTGDLGGASGTAASQLAHGGYEQNAPGQTGSERVLSEDQLIGGVEGNAGDLAAATLAVGSRTASSRGGGGFSQTAKGASGVGYAQ